VAILALAGTFGGFAPSQQQAADHERPALRGADAAEEARLHGGAHPGARDRREHASVQRRQRGVFIRVSRGAPEAEYLRQAGFADVGRVFPHPHQGTARVAFPFANGYLELI